MNTTINLVQILSAPLFCLNLCGAEPLVADKTMAVSPTVFSQYQVPRLSSSRLLFWIKPSFANSGPNLLVWQSAGRQFETKLWFEPSVRISVIDAAASPSGEIAASFAATKLDGTVAWGLELFAPDGKAQRTLRTNPFVPSHITNGPDGNFWVFGVDAEAIHAGVPANLLHRYDRTGNLLTSTLSSSSFSQKVSPPAGEGIYGRTMMGSTATRVWIFIGDAGEWLEYAPDGTLATRVKTSFAHPSQRVESIGMTDSGAPVAKISGSTLKGVYSLNRANNHWTPLVEWAPMSADEKLLGLGHFYGVEGESLVFSAGAWESISWFQVAAFQKMAPSTSTVASLH